MSDQRIESPDRKAIQALVSNTQSTHSLAAQATAARFLRLLRRRYVATEMMCAEVNTLETQTVFLEYLASKMAQLEGKPTDKNTSQTLNSQCSARCPHTLTIVDGLLKCGESSKENTLKVLKQLLSFARKYPGVEGWNDNDDKWSINIIYNAKSKSHETVTASPAETLHLFCAALLDDKHWADSLTLKKGVPHLLPHAPEEEVNSAAASSSQQGAASCSSSSSSSTTNHDVNTTSLETRLADRINLLFSMLLNQQNEEEASELRTCATGQQHALLELLHLQYLDDSLQPCEGIFNMHTAILNMTTEYLKHCLSNLSFEERLQWVACKDKEGDLPVVIRFLNKHGMKPANDQGSEVSWELPLREFIQKKCHGFGLNPATKQVASMLKDVLDNVCWMELPLARSTQEQLQMEVLKLPREFNQVDGGIYPELLQARNQLIQSMQDQLTAAASISLSQLRGMLTTDDCLRRLQAYPQSILICGENEAHFKMAREHLGAELLAYYQGLVNHPLQGEFPESLMKARAAFLEHEMRFKDQLHTEITVNFFGGLPKNFRNDDQSFNAAMQRLLSLGKNCTQHPSILSDDVLAGWEKHHQELVFLPSEDGGIRILEERLYVSTYQVNRLLIHGLLVKPETWSPRFKGLLSQLLTWLLQPISREDGPLLAGLKRSYPPYFLGNLYLQLLLTQWLDVKDPRLQTLFRPPSKSLVYGLDMLDRVCSWLLRESEETFNNCFGKLISHLGLLIRDYSELFALLRIGTLNDEQRQLVLNAVKKGFAVLKHGHVLCKFFSDDLHLADSHRAWIWELVKPNLRKVTFNVRELNSMLKNEHLNHEQKTLIWEVGKPRLGLIISNSFELNTLLNNEHLTPEQKTVVWDAVSERLSHLIKDGLQLKALLSNAHLSHEQKTLICNAITNRLGNLPNIWDAMEHIGILVKNGYQLNALLNHEQLTQEQRVWILETVENSLITIIQSYDQLHKFLRNEHLSEQKRTLVLFKLRDKLNILIDDSSYLQELLYKSKLTDEQKVLVLDALRGNMSSILGFEVDLLEYLDDDTLTLTQKTLIWAGVKENIDSLGFNLYLIHLLEHDFLTPTEKRWLWNAVEHRLESIIEDGEVLCELLNAECLTPTQKARAWEAAENQLWTIMENGSDTSAASYNFNDLLSTEDLSEAQRTKIWEAGEPHLSELAEAEFDELLNNNYLTPAQKAKVWNIGIECCSKALKNHWWDLNLLLKSTHLTDTQRTYIWDLAKPHLERIIHGYSLPQHCYSQFKGLLSNEYIVEAQRTFILNAVSLDDLVSHFGQLNEVLRIQYLTDGHRQLILNSLKEKLGTVFPMDGAGLFLLLDDNLLTNEAKSSLLDAVKPRLNSWITSGHGLNVFLRSNNLTDAHKGVILSAIESTKLARLLGEFRQVLGSTSNAQFFRPAAQASSSTGEKQQVSNPRKKR